MIMRVLRYAGPTSFTGPEGETVTMVLKGENYVWQVIGRDGAWLADLTTLDVVRTMLRVDATEAGPREAYELSRD
jgi:hypothetical protein